MQEKILKIFQPMFYCTSDLIKSITSFAFNQNKILEKAQVDQPILNSLVVI